MSSARAPAELVEQARAGWQAGETALMERQIAICETAAPTGAEAARAGLLADWLSAAGCVVETDAVGNVIARREGRGREAPVAISAHLDTVFPAGQATTVARPGESDPYGGGGVPQGEYHAPGIADCAAGLVALLALAEALQSANLESDVDLLFLATVGEEGRGDLRGAREFFASELGGGIGAFVTIDHTDSAEIAHRGVGSRRYAVEFVGPGGHAWGHFGRYNPAFALAAAADRLAAFRVPEDPRTSFNVGVLDAGGAVNAIPEAARMEIDLRSENTDALNALDAAFRAAMKAGHANELERRPSGEAALSLQPIGERPAGETAVGSPLVGAAQRALQAEGVTPQLVASSTDANAAMAAGIPAVAMGWGGRSGNEHSLREFFAPAGRDRALAALLRLLLELSNTSVED